MDAWAASVSTRHEPARRYLRLVFVLVLVFALVLFVPSLTRSTSTGSIPRIDVILVQGGHDLLQTLLTTSVTGSGSESSRWTTLRSEWRDVPTRAGQTIHPIPRSIQVKQLPIRGSDLLVAVKSAVLHTEDVSITRDVFLSSPFQRIRCYNAVHSYRRQLKRSFDSKEDTYVQPILLSLCLSHGGLSYIVVSYSEALASQVA